jgi:hypothetical protein
MHERFDHVTASGVTQRERGENIRSARYYEVEKWFYDYAENIEAVNIHYACTPLGEIPDWNSRRTTRFLPLVEARLRRKVLKLPARILDPNGGRLCDRYLFHHYFEIFADGDTHYSQLYTEEVLTGAGDLPAPHEASSNQAREPGSDFKGQSASSAKALVPEASTPPQASKRKRSTTTKGK